MLTVALLLLPLATAQTTAAERIDRIVAVVDEDPIFASDLDRAAAFGVRRFADDPAAERQLLDQLIEQRLRLHEVERYDTSRVPEAAIEAQLAEVEERFGGVEGLEDQLRQAGLSRADLRERLRRQLRILAYVEERLAARVFIDDDEIRAHYEGELADELRARGLPLPPLAEIREEIRQVLFERALADEVESWTLSLRQRATIVDLLDRPVAADELPPVVLRLPRDP